MTAPPKDRYRFDQYLTTEREQPTRNEFVTGEVYAMTGLGLLRWTTTEKPRHG